MKLNKQGYDLIKQFEGCRLTAYQDSIGVWTIGKKTVSLWYGKKICLLTKLSNL